MIINPIPQHIQVLVDREELQLPYDLQQSINACWDTVAKEKPYLTRGEIFTISHMNWTEKELQITLQKTDYAHFLFSKGLSFDHPYRCRGVVANGVFLTSDGYFVIGEMNTHTSTPGRLQFVAGGIDSSDLKGDVVDLLGSLHRESQEELGIDLTDSNLVASVIPEFIVQWQSIALIYQIELAIDSRQLQLHYENFESTLLGEGIAPEFSSIIFIHVDQLSHFLKADPREKLEFLPRVLEQLCGETG